MSSDPTADAHDEAAVDVTAPDSVGRWLARLAKGNYIPTRKRAAYGTALLAEYRRAG